MSHLQQLGSRAAGCLARLAQRAEPGPLSAAHASSGLRAGRRQAQTVQQQRRQVRQVAAHARRSLSRELLELKDEKKEIELEGLAPTVTQLEWERPLRVLRYPDPRLRAVNARIAVFDESLQRLAAEMFDVMYTDDGVGLAAPQVGVNVRLMVFNPEGVRGRGEEIVLANPRLVSSSKATDLEEEGCLSFPGMNADVERALKVKIKAQDARGRKFSLELSGWRARIFQHEYDHLQGTLFHDRMAPGALADVRPRLVELEEEFLQLHPGADVQRVQ